MLFFGAFLWKVLYVVLLYCSTAAELEFEVVVTRKGQTTIPALLREKFGIGEGSRLEVVETADGILFRPVKSTVDLAGSGAGFASPEEMKRVLDRIRDLDVY